MFRFIGVCFGTVVRLLRARRSLLLENLALRQQLAVLKRRYPRPRLELLDKLFWVAIRRFWSGWQPSLIAVTPETVVRKIPLQRPRVRTREGQEVELESYGQLQQDG